MVVINFNSLIDTKGIRIFPNTPPPISWCKANFDGAIFQELGAAGLGVVIRDHEGSVIGALSERIALPPSMEDVEALAGRRAIAFAKEIGLQEVIFEGDAEIIINSLFTDGKCMAHFGHLIETLGSWLLA